jgi:hypothetical protein
MAAQARRAPRRKSQQLLVEGEDDRHVVWHLCEQHQLPETFDVVLPGIDEELGGIDPLLQELLSDVPIRLRQGSLRTLGIMIDADAHPQRRWDQLRSAVPEPIRVVMPAVPVAGGWVSEEVPFFATPIRIGVWLMPDGQSSGMLEDFAASLARDDDILLAKAKIVLDEVEQIAGAAQQRYVPAHRSKALIHTWLAWQRHPGRPMGTAIKAGYLRHDAPAALAFVAWLRRLFDPSPSPGVV